MTLLGSDTSDLDLTNAESSDTLPSVITIGVTGQLLLSESQRTHVAAQCREAFQTLRADAPDMRTVHLVSGLAPGADLVLTETLIEECDVCGLEYRLTAVIVDSPEELLKRWQSRATALGISLSPKAIDEVNARMQRNLRRADRQLRLITPPVDPDGGFAQLAAFLAENCPVLFAVLRHHYRGLAGGTRQTVEWWEDPGSIPAALRWWPSERIRPEQRRLFRLAADPGEPISRTPSPTRVFEIRDRLRAGNALAANDLAYRAHLANSSNVELRYLFLLSLAHCGSTRRAMRLYEELAPAETADEDWLALRGRLYKDLAFSGVDEIANLREAAAHYENAHAVSAGSFSAVNAATLKQLAGDGQAAEQLARGVLDSMAGEAPADPQGAYFHHVTIAEACAVIGDWQGCRAALRRADPMLRDDLSTRARTRKQLQRLLTGRNAPGDLLDALAMPCVYVLEQAGEEIPEILEDLRTRLSGSPLYAWQDQPGNDAALKALLRAGMRGYLLADSRVGVAKQPDGVEALLKLDGFLEGEATWQQSLGQRHLHGLARIQADQLGVAVRGLRITSAGWEVRDLADPPMTQAPDGRGMVGLIFSDLVGFSQFSDEAVAYYWQSVVPALASTFERWREAILLKQTWGDAIHLVTTDVHSAASLTQAMLGTIRRLRVDQPRVSSRLEMRIGAHFAPGSQGQDAIQQCPTWFGSQLSLTARVEPVTPPGTTYVTEAFAAELALTAPGEFSLEYCGEVALAKRYGQFRLYSLHPRR